MTTESAVETGRVRAPDKASSKRVDKAELLRAFENFNDLSRTLQDQYVLMQKKVETLSVELEEKNRLLEANLREKEAVRNYLSRILESLTTGVVVCDPRGTVQIGNRAALELSGFRDGWPEGLTLADYYESWRLPADRDVAAECAKDDATIVQVDVGRGGSRQVEVTRTVLLDQDGSEAGWIYQLRDVTRQMLLQAETERNERLVAMGEMAVGIVHEVRNPLGSIELFASMLKNDLAGDADKVRLAENIQNGVRSLNHIIANLLSFTRNRQPVFRPVSVRGLVEESIRYMDHLFRSDSIALELDFQIDNDRITGDAELLKQVFMNLILNGAQAMEETGGALTITVEPGAPGALPNVDEKLVIIRVRDTGCGMTPDVRRRLFNPFFSTKDRGTGLGLALVHNIVRAHGGMVVADSEPGTGSVFTLYLPREQ